MSLPLSSVPSCISISIVIFILLPIGISEMNACYSVLNWEMNGHNFATAHPMLMQTSSWQLLVFSWQLSLKSHCNPLRICTLILKLHTSGWIIRKRMDLFLAAEAEPYQCYRSGPCWQNCMA